MSTMVRCDNNASHGYDRSTVEFYIYRTSQDVIDLQ